MDIQATQYMHGAQTLQGPHRNVAAKETTSTEQQNNVLRDEIRFSDEAMQLSGAQSNESSSAGIRFDLVNRIKAEIAAGTYDTPDKVDIALDRMMQRLNPR